MKIEQEQKIDGQKEIVKPVIRRDFNADKGEIVRWLCDKTGLPFSLMEKRLWTHGWVIADLIEKGDRTCTWSYVNPESAKESIQNFWSNKASQVIQ